MDSINLSSDNSMMNRVIEGQIFYLAKMSSEQDDDKIIVNRYIKYDMISVIYSTHKDDNYNLKFKNENFI